MLIAPLPAEAGPVADRTHSVITLKVRFVETDLMAIAHHSSHLLWLEEARVEYLARRRAEYTRLVAEGVHFPVVDQRTRYRQPARFGDVLAIQTWIGSYTRVTMRFDYVIRRGTDVIAHAETTLACVDNLHAPQRIPANILELCLQHEKDQ